MSLITPSEPVEAVPENASPAPPRDRSRRWLVAALVTAIAVIAALVAVIAWPDDGDDPVAAARAFAVDLVGFTDPVVGPYRTGDNRSGEVAVRAKSTGPATTVMVRRLGADGSWWVIGAATDNVTVTSPAAGDAIASPVSVTGSALAWEGNVNGEIRQDGTRAPLGTGVFTGGGDVMRPFSGSISYSAPRQPYGALVLVTHSAEDGRVWQATVLRVAFDR